MSVISHTKAPSIMGPTKPTARAAASPMPCVRWLAEATTTEWGLFHGWDRTGIEEALALDTSGGISEHSESSAPLLNGCER